MIELFFLGTLLVAAALAWLLTPLARACALRLGFLDAPGPRKIHAAPVAYGGGVAVALALAVAVGLGFYFRERLLPGFQTGRLDIGRAPLLAVAGGAFGALLLGLIDDRYRLSPRTKLLGQAALAIFAVCDGVRITAFIGDNLFMQAVTVLWIVLITNSFNLLDNMDGLCAGVGAISAAMLGVVALDSAQGNLALILGALWSGGRTSALCLLIAHRMLAALERTSLRAYMIGGGAVALLFALAMQAVGIASGPGGLGVDVISGVGAGLFYRLFAGTQRRAA